MTAVQAPVLAALQRTVESLHDVRTGLDVRHYLVSEEQHSALPGACRTLPEQFFVREANDAFEMSLFVAPHVIAALCQDDPHKRLHDGNLDNFCVALEGVSHFVFVAWRADAAWRTSALEMEMQAEVDKFAASWLLLRAQGFCMTEVALPLWRRLFSQFALRDGVPAQQRDRYIEASRGAEHFCRHMVARHALSLDDTCLLHDVRLFSRLSMADKLRWRP